MPMIIPGVPIDPAPYVQSCDVQLIIAGGAAIVGNTLNVHDVPIRSTPLAIAKMRVWVVNQANNVDVGVFSSDGTTLTLVGSSGSTVVGTAGEQIINMLATVVLQPGVQYYLGICPDNVASTWGRAGASGFAISKEGPTFSGGSRATSFPLATNATSFTLASLTAISARFWIRGSAT